MVNRMKNVCLINNPKEYINSYLVSETLVNTLKKHGRLYSANYYSNPKMLDEKISDIVQRLHLNVNYLHFALFNHYASCYRSENINCYTDTGSDIIQNLSGRLVDQCLLLHEFYALDWTDPSTIDKEGGEKKLLYTLTKILGLRI